MPIAPHPDWNALLAASQDEEAWQELSDRLDRMAEHGPATSTRADHAHLAPPISAAPQANGARRPTPPSPRPAGPSLNDRSLTS